MNKDTLSVPATGCPRETVPLQAEGEVCSAVLPAQVPMAELLEYLHVRKREARAEIARSKQLGKQEEENVAFGELLALLELDSWLSARETPSARAGNDLNSATAGAPPASDSRKRNRASGSLE